MKKSISAIIYKFEVESSGADYALGFKDEIDNLKTIEDVKQYYWVNRGWSENDWSREAFVDLLVHIIESLME